MVTNDAPKILVVDDDPDWREFMIEMLGSSCRVQAVANGAAALVRARKMQPALIILDVMMPGGMDGFTTLCELQKEPRTCRIPVIVCSAINALSGLSFSAVELKRHLKVAPAMILEKPVSPDALLAAVAQVLGRKV